MENVLSFGCAGTVGFEQAPQGGTVARDEKSGIAQYVGTRFPRFKPDESPFRRNQPQDESGPVVGMPDFPCSRNSGAREQWTAGTLARLRTIARSYHECSVFKELQRGSGNPKTMADGVNGSFLPWRRRENFPNGPVSRDGCRDKPIFFRLRLGAEKRPNERRQHHDRHVQKESPFTFHRNILKVQWPFEALEQNESKLSPPFSSSGSRDSQRPRRGE